jgi:outer membrane protein OmpA-like peptidoglycan-associated protein
MPPQPITGDRCWKAGALMGSVVGGAGGGFGAAALTEKVGPRIGGGVGGAVFGALVGGLLQYNYLGCPAAPPPAPPVAQPSPAPTPMPTPAPPKNVKIILRGVHFDFNKVKIRPGDAAVLDEAAETFKDHPSLVVNVNGYCDAIGSVAYNLKLSDRRANAVAKYLEKRGVPESHLIPRGYGKSDPVANNDTDEGRAQNRRVELVPVE